MKTNDLDMAILRVLAHDGATELEAMGQEVRRQLERGGLVRCMGNGRWALTDAGRAALRGAK